jgi:hypothetical protein
MVRDAPSAATLELRLADVLSNPSIADISAWMDAELRAMVAMVRCGAACVARCRAINLR